MHVELAFGKLAWRLFGGAVSGTGGIEESSMLTAIPLPVSGGACALIYQCSLPCFIPVSVMPASLGLVGASSLISLPFYLNDGLIKERLIATGAVHSLFIRICKIATYASVGALSSRWSLLEGVAAGSGAVFAIYVTRPWLDTLKEVWFRRLAVVLMLTSGSSMLWQPPFSIYDGVLPGVTKLLPWAREQPASPVRQMTA